MVNITHRVGIKAPLEKVYEALATAKGIANWWTADTTQTGQTIVVRFHTPQGNEIGSMHFELKTLEPNKKIHWEFTAGPEEWLGTEVTYDLHQEEDYTIVLFAHKNWREEVEFKAHCSMKWAVFLLSLKQFAETGLGKPSPHDIKIDNWN